MFDVTLLLTLNSDLTISAEIPATYPATDQPEKPGLYLYSTKDQAIHVHDIKFKADPKYQEGWETFANRAFGSPDASQKILEAFNTNINQEGTRNGFAKAIGGQINDIVSKLK